MVTKKNFISPLEPDAAAFDAAAAIDAAAKVAAPATYRVFEDAAGRPAAESTREKMNELKIPLYTIRKDVMFVGLGSKECAAQIFDDKIIVISPDIKWVGNSVCVVYSRFAIRDRKIIIGVLADIRDDCVGSAWAQINRTLDDLGYISQYSG